MVTKVEKIIKKAHERGNDTGKNLDKAVEWLFDINNKHLIFSAFEEILTEKPKTIENFRADVQNLFDYPAYMGLPKKISEKLSSDEVDVIQKIINNDLVTHYQKDIIKFMEVYKKIETISEELAVASKELENFVTPKKPKLK